MNSNCQFVNSIHNHFNHLNHFLLVLTIDLGLVGFSGTDRVCLVDLKTLNIVCCNWARAIWELMFLTLLTSGGRD